MSRPDPSAPPRLDHCVLPVRSLADARRRLGSLGFTVAPAGRHPFGTANACVYFGDDTFIEPLAIADAQAARIAAGAGNVFVAHDAAYRLSVGEEGFSALVLRSDDALADHERFLREGISSGQVLEFSRPVLDASGQSGQATFRLAFAAAADHPDCLIFTCQRVGVPAIDSEALRRHENGVTGIAGIRLSCADPVAAAGFLAAALGGSSAAPEELGLEIARSRHNHALRPEAIVFAAADPQAAMDLFNRNRIAYTVSGGRLVVPPAPGQGAEFVFEAP